MLHRLFALKAPGGLTPHILIFLAGPWFLTGCLPVPGFLEPEYTDVVTDNCPLEPGRQEDGGCPVDTDGDGMWNKWESDCGYDFEDDTILADPALDDDADGITNEDENAQNTSPCSMDTDNDGFTDPEDACPKLNGRDTSDGCPL